MTWLEFFTSSFWVGFVIGAMLFATFGLVLGALLARSGKDSRAEDLIWETGE